MKALVMVDSFKGSIESKELNRVICEELNKKDIKTTSYSISDGGEGFLDAIDLGYKKRTIKVHDALGKIISSYYIYDSTNAYIELAKVCGLSMIEKKNPLYTSTYGVGELIKDAIEMGFKNIYIGIGGSSTNDLGLGLIEALGAKFNKGDINFITGEKMKDITNIDYSEVIKLIEGINFYCLSDVRNILLGENGASYTFAKQKGASDEEIKLLDEYGKHVVEVLNLSYPHHLSPSSGAAGGVGFILQAILKAKVISGIDFLLDRIDFDNISSQYDFVITGEGKIDNQSLSGKVIDGICKRSKSKVYAIVGIDDLKYNPYQNLNILAITPKYATVDESIKNPIPYIRQLIKNL